MPPNRRFPTNELFKSCKLLKINNLANFLATKFVYRSIYPNAYTHEQLSYYFKLNIDYHDRDVRDKLKIRLPVVKSVLIRGNMFSLVWWILLEQFRYRIKKNKRF